MGSELDETKELLVRHMPDTEKRKSKEARELLRQALRSAGFAARMAERGQPEHAANSAKEADRYAGLLLAIIEELEQERFEAQEAAAVYVRWFKEDKKEIASLRKAVRFERERAADIQMKAYNKEEDTDGE